MVELFIGLVYLYPFVFLTLIAFGVLIATTFWVWNSAENLKDEKKVDERMGVNFFSLLVQLVICGSIGISAAVQNFTGEAALNSKGEEIFGSELNIWLFYGLWIIINLAIARALWLEKKKHPEIFKTAN